MIISFTDMGFITVCATLALVALIKCIFAAINAFKDDDPVKELEKEIKNG